MKRIFVPVIVSIFCFVTVGASLVRPVYAQAETSSTQACETLKEINPDGKACAAGDSSVNKVIRVALNLLSVVAGVVAVIMVIIAGLKYITSQGDSNQISSSKKTLIYAIVGLVVVAFAQIIVKFVVHKV